MYVLNLKFLGSMRVAILKVLSIGFEKLINSLSIGIFRKRRRSNMSHAIYKAIFLPGGSNYSMSDNGSINNPSNMAQDEAINEF